MSHPSVALALGVAAAVVFGRAAAQSDGRESITLSDRIEAVVAAIQSRELNSHDTSPWSIMHGMIAFGEDAVVYDDNRQDRVDAIEYLLTRATHDGKPIFVEDDGLPVLPIHKRVQHIPIST